MRKQASLLDDVADFLTLPVQLDPGQGRLLKENPPGVGGNQPDHQPQQSRLTAATGAHHGIGGSTGQAKAGPLQGLFVPVTFANINQFEHDPPYANMDDHG